MLRITALVFAAFVTSACVGEREDPPTNGVPATDGDQAADAHMGTPAGQEGETHGHATAAPGEGQTLLVIMQKLGVDMAALTHGLMTEDTALVARSADAVAAHPDIAPGEVERIHAELGASMPEFERLDAAVHEESVALRDAARAGDMEAVLDRLHAVQRGCVECHTQFRQRLRTIPGG